MVDAIVSRPQCIAGYVSTALAEQDTSRNLVQRYNWKRPCQQNAFVPSPRAIAGCGEKT